MAKLSQADKMRIQTLCEQGLGANKTVRPLMPLDRFTNGLSKNIPDFITKDATAT
jgi:hypothetical protein